MTIKQWLDNKWFLWEHNRWIFWWSITRRITATSISFTIVLFILWLVSLYWAYLIGLHSLGHQYNVTPLLHS